MSAGARGASGGTLDGNELFQQALQKNLDIIRNRLYQGVPPPDTPAPRRYEEYMQGARPASAKSGADELSRWLERVYGASLSSAPSTKATRVRPASATSSTAQRRAGGGTGALHGQYANGRVHVAGLTSANAPATRASPYSATHTRTHAYGGAALVNPQHRQARPAPGSSLRPSSAKATLSSTGRASSQGRKASGREDAAARKPRKKGGVAVDGRWAGADDNAAAAARERRWAQDSGVIIDDDEDGEGDLDAEDRAALRSHVAGSPLSCISAGDGESDLIYDDDDDDAEADVFDADLLDEPRPPSGIRAGPPSAGFLRPGAARAPGDTWLGAAGAPHISRGLPLEHGPAGGAHVERDELVSPQRVRRSLDRYVDTAHDAALVSHPPSFILILRKER